MYRLQGVRNFVVDQGYADAVDVIARAGAAAEECQPGGENIAAALIEYVLGDPERVALYEAARVRDIVRYY